jgi:hypothetical protein
MADTSISVDAPTVFQPFRAGVFFSVSADYTPKRKEVNISFLYEKKGRFTTRFHDFLCDFP